jgi:acyl-CoA thioesterase
LETIASFFRERDRFARHAGIELVEIGPGRALARLRVRKEHLNGVDTGHGGAIFTLADFAFAVAVNSHGVAAVASGASVTFVRPAREGDVLLAEAVETARQVRVSVCSVTVTDAAGQTVAVFLGTAFRKDRPLLPGTEPAAPGPGAGGEAEPPADPPAPPAGRHDSN